jgi:DNA-binding response OmpR family regulator
MAKILLVEDDLLVSKSVSEWVAGEAHTVEVASSGEDAMQLLKNFSYDLIILDWSLPGISGVEVCKNYRAAGGSAWIIFLTGKGDIDSKEQGLDVGADDYLTKPFQMRELAARIRSALRRSDAHFQPELKIGDVQLSTATQSCIVRDVAVHLMPKEAALLEFLMRNPNRLFNTKKLLDSVWSSDAGVSEGIIRTYIRTLRQKLEALGQPDFIKTVPGAGYIIEIDNKSAHPAESD